MNYMYSKECNNDGGLATDLVHVSIRILAELHMNWFCHGYHG